MSIATHKRLSIGYPIAVGILTVCVGLALSSVLDADSSRTARPLPIRASILAERPRSMHQELRAALDHHYASRSDAAITKWDAVELPNDRQVWKHLAVAVAHLGCEAFVKLT